jgi:hypothetical protein
LIYGLGSALSLNFFEQIVELVVEQRDVQVRADSPSAQIGNKTAGESMKNRKRCDLAACRFQPNDSIRVHTGPTVDVEPAAKLPPVEERSDGANLRCTEWLVSRLGLEPR